MLDTTIVPTSSKFCHVCKQAKPLDAFSKNKSRYDGKQSNCKMCDKTYQSIRYKSRERKTRVMRIVGFSQKDYDLAFEQQNGLCAICGKPEAGKNQWGIKKLAMDHNHETGEVRQLLCNRCNALLGWVERDRQLIKKMEKYLKKHDR